MPNTAAIPAPLDALVAAVNAGDTDRFLSLFTNDGVVDDWGTQYTGPREIRAWSDRELIGAHGVMTVRALEHDQGRAVLLADWASTYYTGPGRFTFDIQGGKIARWTIAGT